MSDVIKTTVLLILGIVVGVVCGPYLTRLLPTTVDEDLSPTTGVTITYTIPNQSDIDGKIFPDYRPEDEKQQPVSIPLPLDVVNQLYIDTFNDLANSGIVLEDQLKTNVYNAMLAVQQEAQAGNYLVMFQKILDAKKEVEILRSRSADLDAKNLAFRKTYVSMTLQSNVKIASQELDTVAVTLVDDVARLTTLLDEALNGNMPSQELLNQVNTATIQINKTIESFGEKVGAVTAAVRI